MLSRETISTMNIIFISVTNEYNIGRILKPSTGQLDYLL